MNSNSRLLLLPSWVIASTIVLWLSLPHLALRFSYLPVLPSIYAAFIGIIFISVFCVVLLRFHVQKYIISILMILAITASFGASLGLSYGRSWFDVAKSAYELLAPIVLLLLILLSRITTVRLVRSVVRPFLWVIFLNVLYTMYQYFWIHRYQELWFYEPLTKMGNELSSWDYEISNTSNASGKTIIRAPGIFTSPLENVYVISMVSIYFAIKTIRTNVLYAFPTFFYVLAGYMTGVRTFFVGILIALLSWIVIEKKISIKPFYLFILIPFVCIFATYLFIFLNFNSLDLSALGRFEQLTKVLWLLMENPMGYGFGAIGIRQDYLFDSVYGTWFVSLGVLGGSAIVYIYYWLSKQLMDAFTSVVDHDERIFLLTLILFSIVFAYISQFQYALMTPGRWYYVIAAAIVLNRLNMNKANNRFLVAQ